MSPIAGDRTSRRAGVALLAGYAGMALLAGCGDATRERAEPAPQPPLVLAASVDRARPTTGDTILYRVLIDRDERLAVEVPEFGAEIAGLRIVDAGAERPQRAAGRERVARWYKLRADLPQVYVLPPLRIEYPRPVWYDGASGSLAARQSGEVLDAGSDTPAPSGGADGASDGLLSAATPEIFIEVGTRLDGSSEGLRGLKPLPRPPGWPWWLWTVGTLTLVALVAALVVALRRRRAPPGVVLPAHELAYQALRALAAESVTDLAGLRLWYYRLSGALRAYLEGRFGLNATDLTTEEITPRLFSLPALDEPHRRQLVELLRRFDEVKYADRLADDSGRQADLSAVSHWVDDTRELTDDVEEEDA